MAETGTPEPNVPEPQSIEPETPVGRGPGPEQKPMAAWKSALIGLGVGVGIVLATSPIGLYMAFGRQNELKPGAIAVGVLWLVVLGVSTVVGGVAPGVLRRVDGATRGPK